MAVRIVKGEDGVGSERLELADDEEEHRRRIVEALVGEQERSLGRHARAALYGRPTLREVHARALAAATGRYDERTTGPAWRRLGMGWGLGLGEVEGVVLVEAHDSATVRGFFTPLSAIVEVWGGDEEAVRVMVEHRRPHGAIVLVLWRRSTWWLRMRLRAAYAWRRIARLR
jgi:hypothetical protein